MQQKVVISSDHYSFAHWLFTQHSAYHQQHYFI